MGRKRLWAGVDAGVETSSLCIVDDCGEVVHECTCPSNTLSLRRELTKFRRTRYASVAWEAGTAMHVACGLQELGYPVEVFEVRQLSKFLRIRRDKTDAGDAAGIAEAGRLAAPRVSRVYLKSVESRSLQSCLAIRRHLIRQRVAAVNMLCRQFEQFGGRLRVKATTDGFRHEVDAEIRKLFPRARGGLVGQLKCLADHCDALASYQRAVDRALKLTARRIEVCRRFMEIPGVGPLCALAFYAAVDDPRRFPRCHEIGSYFGLAPRKRESGLIVRKSHISKMGNAQVRTLLVHAAGMHILHSEPTSALRTWALAIEERHARAPSRVALARKLAVIMLTMWKEGTRFSLSGSGESGKEAVAEVRTAGDELNGEWLLVC